MGGLERVDDEDRDDQHDRDQRRTPGLDAVSERKHPPNELCRPGAHLSGGVKPEGRRARTVCKGFRPVAMAADGRAERRFPTLRSDRTSGGVAVSRNMSRTPRI